MNVILQRLKQYPFALLCGVLLLLSVFGLILRGGLGAELTAREGELAQRIRTIESNAKHAKDLESQVESMAGYVEAIAERLFKRDERALNTNFFYAFEDRGTIMVSFVRQLSGEDPALAKGGPHELKLHSTLMYEITVQGMFNEVLALIYQLYRVDPLIRVSDFEVEKIDGIDAQAVGVEARLRVVVLASKE